MAAWIKMPLATEVGLGPGDFVLDGDLAPLPKKGAEPPNFQNMSIVAKHLDGSKWHLAHCARWGPSSPTQKGDRAPQFSAHVCDGQTAGWIKIPLGTEINLGPGDVVLDGSQLPLKGTQPPVFGPCLLWPNSWMDEDATWYGSRLGQATLR